MTPFSWIECRKAKKFRKKNSFPEKALRKAHQISVSCSEPIRKFAIIQAFSCFPEGVSLEENRLALLFPFSRALRDAALPTRRMVEGVHPVQAISLGRDPRKSVERRCRMAKLGHEASAPQAPCGAAHALADDNASNDWRCCPWEYSPCPRGSGPSVPTRTSAS